MFHPPRHPGGGNRRTLNLHAKQEPTETKAGGTRVRSLPVKGSNSYNFITLLAHTRHVTSRKSRAVRGISRLGSPAVNHYAQPSSVSRFSPPSIEHNARHHPGREGGAVWGGASVLARRGEWHEFEGGL